MAAGGDRSSGCAAQRRRGHEGSGRQLLQIAQARTTPQAERQSDREHGFCRFLLARAERGR
jgi:hypothetical protein